MILIAQSTRSCTPTEWLVTIGIGIVACLFFLAYLRAESALQALYDAWAERKKTLRASGASAQDWESWLRDGEQVLKEANARPTELGGEIARAVRQDLRTYEAARAAASMFATTAIDNHSGSVADLARLRSENLISPEEFEALTERFRRSNGSKASEMIHAIEKLHEQYKSGAMSQGNYKASLWTLMDRLDREMK